jgi:hypothetical protein
MNSSLLLALVALAPLSCASALQPEVASVGTRDARPAQPLNAAEPFAEAGTRFAVQADQPLDTYYSTKGEPFTATVVNPLFGPLGQPIVLRGAKLRGQIASVGTYELPKLRLVLLSIDTVEGPVPIEAAIRQSQHYEWAGPDPLDIDPTSGRPPVNGNGEPHEIPHPANLFGYQAAYGYGTTQPREVRIPRGAILEIALVAPLVLVPRFH